MHGILEPPAASHANISFRENIGKPRDGGRIPRLKFKSLDVLSTDQPRYINASQCNDVPVVAIHLSNNGRAFLIHCFAIAQGPTHCQTLLSESPRHRLLG